MSFVIETVTDHAALVDVAHVRREVFEGEWKLQVPPLPPHNAARMMTFLARAKSGSGPAAVLTVMETTGDHDLHRRVGLSFDEGARVARYTQLAVLKPYRGLSLPLQLVLEARRQFVLPRQISHTWLLFDAGRAPSSSFCRFLGFRASFEEFKTEYGCSRVLTRNEPIHSKEVAYWSQQAPPPPRSINGHAAVPAEQPPVVASLLSDEWAAQ